MYSLVLKPRVYLIKGLIVFLIADDSREYADVDQSNYNDDDVGDYSPF